VSTVGINKMFIRRDVRYQVEQNTGHAQLEFWVCHARKGVGIYDVIAQMRNLAQNMHRIQQRVSGHALRQWKPSAPKQGVASR